MHQPWAQHPPGPPDPVPGAHPGTHLISISAKLLASVLKEGKKEDGSFLSLQASPWYIAQR